MDTERPNFNMYKVGVRILRVGGNRTHALRCIKPPRTARTLSRRATGSVPPYHRTSPYSQRCSQPAVAHQRCTDAPRPTRFMHSCSQPPAPPCQQTCLRARLSVQCAAAVGRACTCTSAAGLTPPPSAVEPRPTSASRPRVGSTAGLWITAQLLLSSGIIIGPRRRLFAGLNNRIIVLT